MSETKPVADFLRFRSIVAGIRQFLNRVKRSDEIGEFLLTDLAPQDDADRDDEKKTYYKCLNSALNNDRVTNIALTGHYGCGKSTILRTFEKHYGGRHKFLSVSLATFGKEGKVDLGTERTQAIPEEAAAQSISKAEDQKRLSYLVEHSILQQIFYQVPKRIIPRSRFKRISRPRFAFLPWVVFLSWLFCIGCAIALFHPETFKPILSLYPLLEQMSNRANTLLSAVALGTVLIPVWYLFRVLNTVTLRKLNLKACEIEIAEDKDPSVLNKHLDEILYFFEATDYDVVVLEDLDRFETPDVFTKLREINTLINCNIRIHSPRCWPFKTRNKIVFIYAIRDEMFTGEERTKFFDLIIPVVPVVNHANSRDLLRRELDKREATPPFMISEVLLSDIALYVPDMRLLYNIVNEFAVYRERLNMAGMTDESLLALMVYKNIFPRDFVALQKRQGLLYEYFSLKPSYREKRVREFENAIKSKRDLQTQATQTAILSESELRKLYVYQLQEQAIVGKSGWTAFDVNIAGTWQPFSALTEADSFDQVVTSKHITMRMRQVRGYEDQVQVKFADVEKSLDPTRSYSERKAIVAARTKESQGAIEEEINRLRNQIAEVKHAKLKDILQAGGVILPDPRRYLPDDESEIRERKCQLLHLLLKQGYIDEMYQSYLSYFYEGTLTNQDRVFVISVKNSEPLDSDYELHKVAEVIAGLTEHEAIIQATRNIYVLNHMLMNTAFGEVVERLKADPEATLSILTLHLRTDGFRHEELVRRVYKHWPEFWGFIQTSDALSPSERDLYLSQLIMHATPDLLKKICDVSSLKRYISDRADFISFAEAQGIVDQVVAFLENVQPEFTSLSAFPRESRLARLIYEQNMYEVNAPMVSLMYRTFIGDLCDECPPALSSIFTSQVTPLRANIERHLDAYVGLLSQMDGALMREDANTVLWLLNNTDVSHELRLEIANGLCAPISNIMDVDEDAEIWQQLLDAQAITPSWENVWAFIRTVAQDGLDDTLIAFLQADSVAAALRRQPMDQSFLTCQNGEPNLASLLLSAPELGNKAVSQLVQAIPSDYIVRELSSLYVESIPFMIGRNQVLFTADNYNFMREKCRQPLGMFVKNNLAEFRQLVPTIEINGDDLHAILEEQQRRKRKKEIAEVVLGKGILKQLNAVADELCRLMQWDTAFAQTLDLEMLSAILVGAQDRALKIETLTLCMDWIRDENISAILQSAGGDYNKLADHGPMRALSKTPQNENLAAALLKRGYVSSVNEEDDAIRINTFKGQRKTELE